MTTGERGLVVVSGGSRGIGRAIVTRLVADGYRVASISARGDEHRDAAAGSFAADVTDESEIEDVFRQLDDVGVPLVGAVTAAGINRRGDALDVAVEDFRRILDVNVIGSFLVAREAARRMAPGEGSIVLISSTMAFVGSRRRQAPYGASKGAVGALTAALAVEWADLGIRVNAIAPTFTETEMNAPVLADPAQAAGLRASIPLGRFGTPEDVAGAAAWLLGADAAFVTGHTLCVDGGYLAL